MASFSSGLNPNVVKTALDDVFFQEFDFQTFPGYADATTDAVFRQSTLDRQAHIAEVFKGTGLWETRAEEQNVPQATPRVGDQITHTVTNFAQSVDIPKNYFDDDQHDTVNRMIEDMAATGRVTRNDNAYGIFRNAFGTTLTADGAALISDSHTNLNGDTVDNKLTAALSYSSLKTAVQTLREQKAQDGTIRGHVPAVLLVPPAQHDKAIEITQAELAPETADNDANYISRLFPGLMVLSSEHIGAAAGGDDNYWFLLGRNHSIFRWVRQPIETTLVDWRYQRNNNYIYKGEFREVVGPISYEGIVGSDGSA